MKLSPGIRSTTCAAALIAGAGALLAGCTDADARAPEVQRVEIEATARGFVPDTVRLVAGTPAELVFTRTTSSGCVAQVHAPDLGIGPTALPRDEAVTLRIAEPVPGSYEFRCGMDMHRTTVIVGMP
jgi:plastocyanin domain-containing protein